MSSSKPYPVLRAALTAGAVLVAAAGGVVAGIVCSFLVPLRLGTVHVPVCFVLAAAAAVVTVRFAHRVTGSLAATAAPTLGWFATVVALAGRRPEGDLVVTGGWVGLGLLLVGSIAFGAAVVLELNAGLRKSAQVHRPEAVTGPVQRGTM